MNSRVLGKVVVAAVAILIVIGCSSHRSDGGLGSLSQDNAYSSSSYFPLEAGWTSTFDVAGSTSSSTLTFVVGEEVPFGSGSAHQWLIVAPGGTVDSNYVVATATGVFVYASSQSLAEQILHLPLEVGMSWSRVDGTGGADTTSIATTLDGTITKGLDTGLILETRKLIPITGDNQLVVQAVEELALSNGLRFNSAYRISNAAGSGTSNNYWFVSGVGLVKYVLGATAQNPEGLVRGEIVSYGKQ
jgi:hypothetical protein